MRTDFHLQVHCDYRAPHSGAPSPRAVVAGLLAVFLLFPLVVYGQSTPTTYSSSQSIGTAQSIATTQSIGAALLPSDGAMLLTVRHVGELPSDPGEPAALTDVPAVPGQVAPAVSVPAMSRLPRLNAGWNGFALQNASGTRTMAIKAEFKEDGRVAPGNQPPVAAADPLLFRYSRVGAYGSLARWVNYGATLGYSGGFFFNNGYIELPLAKTFRIRVGRDKPDVAYEVNQPGSATLFMERGFTASLLPSYDDGIQATGEAAGSALHYAVGLFRGVVDGSPAWSTNNALRGGGADLTGRIVLNPFDTASRRHSALAGLGFGVGATAGRHSGTALASYKTSIQDKFFAYDGSATSDGLRTRFTPNVFYDYKNIGGFAEYARSQQALTNGIVHTTVANQAWQVAAYITLTGETGERFSPRRVFDPMRHAWGGIRLSARYGQLTVDPNVFALDLAKAGASQEARQTTVGLLWYLSAKTIARFDYEHVTFAGGTARAPQNALLYRFDLLY
jgi:hypothetical protein